MSPFSNKKLSAEESRFVRLWIQRVNKLNWDVGFTIAPFVLLTYAALLAMVGNSVTQRFAPLYAGWGVLMLITWPLRLHHFAKLLLITVAICMAVVTTSLNMSELRDPQYLDALSRQRVTLIMAVILYGILTAHAQIFNLVVGAFSIGVFAYLNRGIPGLAPDVVILGICTLGSSAILFLVGHHQSQIALRELSIRSKMAPRHIVAGSGLDLAGLERAFAPKPRTGVYVSTDWRGYQQLSDSVDMVQLASILGEYYDVCEEVLRRSFSDGNYYFDWIADELFIVFFETETMPISEVCQRTLEACVDLMRAKHRFYKKFGFPRSIDIGISTGEAVVGMMGPKSFQKATALGSVPGEARRMQSLGKTLRQIAGDYDRMIFGAAVKSLLAPGTPIAEQDLDASQHAKDLKDQTVYFMLPRYEDSASPTTRYYEPTMKAASA